MKSNNNFFPLEYQENYNGKDQNGNDNIFTKMVNYFKENGPVFGNKLLEYEKMDQDILFCYLNLAMTSTATVKFKERMTYEKLSDAVTLFEEAFGVLVLENNLSRWIYMAERKRTTNMPRVNDDSSTSDTTNEAETDASEEVPDVLYQARVKQRKDKIDTAGKWTQKGMKRLNELLTLVQEGRNGATREEFERSLQRKYVHYADSNVELRNKNKRKRELEEMTVVSNKTIVIKNVLNLVAL